MTMNRRVVASVDIGASGGRVIAAIFDQGHVTLDPIHRFPNGPVHLDGHLRWCITELFEQILVGLTALASKYPEVESIGITTWAVDYGLLDHSGHLIGQPISYRDDRTSAAVNRVHTLITQADLFALNGLQFLPFNTVYQLAEERQSPHWRKVAHVVLLPDLFAYWLTGVLRTEYTNATTTGLVSVQTGDWSADLLALLDIDPSLFPLIQQAGEPRGKLLSVIADRIGVPASTVVTTVGSHDTASAVVGIPAKTERVAYIVSGTWSLVGVELFGPILSPEAFDANFTNEGGVDGRTRFLRNVGGLWLLQESMRTWAEQGTPYELQSLLEEAARLPPGGSQVDVEDEAFITPGDMPTRIANAVAGWQHPRTPAHVVRCIIDSLAAAYGHAIHDVATISGHTIDEVHIVGGGSQNDLLCQLTADHVGVPVIAGPVEATAMGNALVQARAIGAVTGGLQDLRAMVADSIEFTKFKPRPRS
jgi:rhamnulokinase